MTARKVIHTIVLDAGPILKNDPTVSTLLAKSERLVTTVSVIAEIKDVNARTRVESTLLPFLTIAEPNPKSVKFISDFARRSGDLPVLSKPDIEILALAYEIEGERNGGDWRLRKTPGQKELNGSPPKKKNSTLIQATAPEGELSPDPSNISETGEGATVAVLQTVTNISQDDSVDKTASASTDGESLSKSSLQAIPSNGDPILNASDELQNLAIVASHFQQEGGLGPHRFSAKQTDPQPDAVESESSDSEGWITPSNIEKQKAKDLNASTVPIPENSTMQVATITTDFAMQNVLLQVGLNLLSPSLQRIRTIRTYILRCHGCFQKVKDMSKQFCPRCGKPTLTRVSCSTNQKGEFKIHLKKNMQWNHRGDRFSIPKPVPGASNGKVGRSRGGGKGGWGQELILAEDQKEYLRAMSGGSRRKEKDLMDEDYLPGILTGDRGRNGGRPKVGAGRNVNSKKRVV